MRGVTPRQQGRNRDDVARVEIRRRDLAFQFRTPKVVPALELYALYEVSTITDRIDVGPSPQMKRAYSSLVGEVLGIRNLGDIERLEQPIVRVEPSDMRGREGNVALRI